MHSHLRTRPSSIGNTKAAVAAALLVATGAALALQQTLPDVSPSGTLLSVRAGFRNGNGTNPVGALGMLPGQHQCNASVTPQSAQLLQHGAA